MGLREELVALGIPIPDEVPIDHWAAKIGDAPCRNLAALVGLSALVFYAAEKHHNPKVNDVWDALVYTSTCVSVGYADIFAKTPIGKILGSALMTMGPSITASALDGPRNERRDATQEQILETLREILARVQGPQPSQTSGETDAGADADANSQ